MYSPSREQRRVLVVEGDVDVVPREPAPERYRPGVERRASREPRFERGDVVRGGARLLHLVVLDGGILGDVDLGDDVVQVYGAVESEEVLDHGDTRPRACRDHDPRGVRALAPLCPGDEDEVHGRIGDRPRGGPDHRAGVHERGVQRGERGLLRAHDPREQTLEERGVAFEARGKSSTVTPGGNASRFESPGSSRPSTMTRRGAPPPSRNAPLMPLPPGSVPLAPLPSRSRPPSALLLPGAARGAAPVPSRSNARFSMGRHVRVLPVLVAWRREARTRERIGRRAPHVAQPRQIVAGQRRFAPGERLGVPGRRCRRVRSCPRPPPPAPIRSPSIRAPAPDPAPRRSRCARRSARGRGRGRCGRAGAGSG